jgi:hypothetical protein
MSLYLNFLNLKGSNPKNRDTITLLKVSFKTQLPSFNCCHLASTRCSARLENLLVVLWLHSAQQVRRRRQQKNKFNAAVAQERVQSTPCHNYKRQASFTHGGATLKPTQSEQN